MADGQLRVAESEQIALMQVIGRGTFKMAVGFKQWIEAIVSSQTLKSVMLDLGQCSSLDSTFMGLMVTLAIQSKRRFALLVVNANETHHKLLDEIGVSRAWRYVENPVADLNWTTLARAACGSVQFDKATCDIIVSAHEALMELDEANIPKFRDVVEMMKQE